MASMDEVQRLFTAARSASGVVGTENADVATEMRLNRQASYGGSSLSMAGERSSDPMFYWKNSNLPYNIWQPTELARVREFCRLLYLTHPVIGSVIDVFSTYPLVGMEMVCPKSDDLADFYNSMFMDDLCNPPEAPVWMGDYSFKPLGDVREGDEVMGWVKSSTSGRKVLRRSKVLATRRRMADDLVKVTMESGREIVCTSDHVWANFRGNERARTRSQQKAWSPTPRQQAEEKRRMRAADLFEEGLSASQVATELGVKGNLTYLWRNKWQEGGRSALLATKSPGWQGKYPNHVHDEWTVAFPGVELIHVIDPTPDLTDDKQRRAAAWLGGVYDGEGCGKAISQSISHNPDVHAQIGKCLDALDIRWGADDKAVYIGARKGERGHQAARQEFVNFLNWAEPVRRTTKAIDKALMSSLTGGSDRVVSVEPIGPGEVVSLTTETGNYTAWGYASKNCYDEFLIDVGKEYWKVGEAFPLGSFNELLGTWEADELMLPEDVKVVRSPFLKEPRFEMRLPAHIRKIINERKPQHEYQELMTQYPELARYATTGDLFFSEENDDPRTWIPVSNMVMSQVKQRGDAFHERGVPILMRAFRPLIQEEALNAAQDAIASRLYTPLILAKIGASATDLGTEAPWIPTRGDLDSFTEDLNSALMADFRLITHHFAVDITNVFGRENMPDLSPDFDRLQDRMLQAFGMSKTMLSGASSGETYAADAMNRDLLTQLLSTFQKRIKRFVKHRAAVVAEAQGHYDFEMKGGRAVPIMEEVVETDPDTGNQRIVRQPKLLLPDMRIRSMNLKDEDNMHTLLEGLRESGVPISMRSRLVNVPVNLEEEIEATKREQVDQAVAAQEARKETYIALRKRNLPIPQDLLDDFQPRVSGGGEASGDPVVTDTVGFTDPASTVSLVPIPEDFATAPNQDQAVADAMSMTPTNRALMAQEPVHRQPESDEMRADMPKASVLEEDGFEFTSSIGSIPDSNDSRILTRAVVYPGQQGDDPAVDSGTAEVDVPVLGSYHTRHAGYRDPRIFFLGRSDSDI